MVQWPRWLHILSSVSFYFNYFVTCSIFSFVWTSSETQSAFSEQILSFALVFCMFWRLLDCLSSCFIRATIWLVDLEDVQVLTLGIAKLQLEKPRQSLQWCWLFNCRLSTTNWPAVEGCPFSKTWWQREVQTLTSATICVRLLVPWQDSENTLTKIFLKMLNIHKRVYWRLVCLGV